MIVLDCEMRCDFKLNVIIKFCIVWWNGWFYINWTSLSFGYVNLPYPFS